ncbi:MAG: RNA 2',3'-cyclic phosphodiesterase [Shimia sp.]
MTRAFIGLPCPEPWIAPLTRLRDQIRAGHAVPEEDLHLTLAFLDDQPEAVLEAVAEELSVLRAPAPILTAQGPGAFGAPARTLILDVARSDALGALRDAVHRACRVAGITLPRARFRPHITLRRFGRAGLPDPAALTRVMETPLTLPPTEAEEIVLWASTLTPDGPVYDPLAATALGTAPPGWG